MQDPFIGHQFDTYAIQALLGSGGMAQVYQAYDTALGRTVALKILDATMQRQAAFAERFLHEARTLAQFRHPGIVPIYTVGEAQGRPYLVQELLPGPTLEAELAIGGHPAPAAVQAIIDDVASALDYAHARGIIHRDLKPANLMRNSTGQMVLMDFGIAKAITGTEKLTQTGMVLGTPHYLAPEQARGGALTPAVDIYALGVILFELLTGVVPFADPSPLAVAIAHLSTPPPAPRSLRPDLALPVEAVVLQALAKAPEARFASAGALASALRVAWDAPAIGGAPDVQAATTPTLIAPPDALSAARDLHAMPTTVNPAAEPSRATLALHALPTTVNPALAAQAEQARAATPPASRPVAGDPIRARLTQALVALRPAGARLVRALGALRMPDWLRRMDRRLLGGAAIAIVIIVIVARGASFDAVMRAAATRIAQQTAGGASMAQAPGATGAAADFQGPVLIPDALMAARWHTQQERGGTMVYEGDRYHLSMPPGTNTFWSLAPRGVTIPNDTVAITVTITPRQGKGGLVFGFRGLNDHYRLLSQADGSFALERRQGTAVTTLATGLGAGAGQLGLVLRGATVRAYFGTILLHEQTLDAAPGGSIGVILVTPDAGDVLFDTLTVRRAP